MIIKRKQCVPNEELERARDKKSLWDDITSDISSRIMKDVFLENLASNRTPIRYEITIAAIYQDEAGGE